MICELNGKTFVIPNEEIDNLQTKLKISRPEAADVWLTDHGYTKNEIQELLNNKAKTAPREKTSSAKGKPRKPRTVKISEEKQMLFKYILGGLVNDFANVEVLTENKLISVEIDGKKFKIDITECRKPKN
jgi:hypothetical protein